MKLRPANTFLCAAGGAPAGGATAVLVGCNVPVRSASLRFVSVKLKASLLTGKDKVLTLGSRFLWLATRGLDGTEVGTNNAEVFATEPDVDGFGAASDDFFLLITSGVGGSENNECISLSGCAGVGVLGRGPTGSFPLP